MPFSGQEIAPNSAFIVLSELRDFSFKALTKLSVQNLKSLMDFFMHSG